MKKVALFLVLVIITSLSFSQKLTLEDVWQKYTFYPSTVSGIRSMNDGLFYTTQVGNKIVKFSYKTGKEVETIFDLAQVKGNNLPNSVSDYEFSSDEKKLIISNDVEPIYRHSFTANFYVYDLQTKEMTKIFDNKIQLATFSPLADKVAFVYKNNLYYQDLVKKQTVKVTTDGEWNNIINGVPDWVYEEEFSFSKAFEWSPNEKNIAFIRFDESKVKEFDMTYYGTLYPKEYKFKYPKAGETNSVVEVHIYDLDTKKDIKVDIGEETDQYISRIKWTKDANTLSFIRLNRLQNKFELLLADNKTGKSNVIFTEEDKRYVELYDDLTFLDDGKNFIISSEKDGFKHLYLYDINGKLINQITKGNFDIDKFLGYDKKTDLVYFTSTENSPLERQLYSVKKDGTSKKQLTTKKGTHNIDFSKSFKYYIDFYTNANTPNYITLNTSKGEEIRVLQDNKRVVDLMKSYNFVNKEFFTFKTSEGVELNGWTIKPANFDASKKYPVYMYLYGGPGSQEVKDSWGYNAVWHQLLAQKGYLVVCIDNRGTGGRGADFKKITYGQLGKYETIDQIEAAKYIGNLPYTDEKRISIQGWSYGGYMSTLCLEKGADVFKTAIAVAPVTNWRFYDSIYTERYMGLPQANAEGYDDNSPINHTEKIKGNLLLMHGMADDNVHFQNSTELITNLIKNDVQFDLMVYPNKNHGIYGGNTRYYLFTKLLNFLEENL